MTVLDLAKRDVTVAYGDRTIALPAYQQEGGWHGVIIENRTPIGQWLAPAADPGSCFAAAVAFIAGIVDAPSGAMTARA